MNLNLSTYLAQPLYVSFHHTRLSFHLDQVFIISNILLQQAFTYYLALDFAFAFLLNFVILVPHTTIDLQSCLLLLQVGSRYVVGLVAHNGQEADTSGSSGHNTALPQLSKVSLRRMRLRSRYNLTCVMYSKQVWTRNKTSTKHTHLYKRRLAHQCYRFSR